MKEKDDENRPKGLTEQERERMAAAAQRISDRLPRKIRVNGKSYTVRQVSKAVRRRIHGLELEAYMLSELQRQGLSLKKARQVQDKLDRLHAKTAAYYLLGNRALWVPWAWALTWRKIMREPEEVSAQINNAAVNDEELGFSSANWDITKYQLALSMRPIGEGVRQMLKRWESARQQADEDATKKKEEDSK